MAVTGKILIVDDEDRIRFFLREVLLRDGHQVREVADGTSAVDLLTKEEFDLALIDLNL